MNFFENAAFGGKRPEPLRVAILGASGSIGTQTLDVCRQHSDKLRVVAISVFGSVAKAAAIAREFSVEHVVIVEEQRKGDPAVAQIPDSCDVSFGDDALVDLVARDDVDCVVSAVVGFAGINAGYAALKANKLLVYANKESLVCGGDLLMPLAKPGQLIPVDSEHSAIFQCLVGERRSDIYRVWLTCSGGPFYGMSREELSRVKPADALRHPTWHMGEKITIDSATLMNKGLEVLEAHHLFGVEVDRVNVLVHRQSMVHSMVEFSDGVVKAQLGPSDMRIPIQYALSYPDRWETPSDRVDYWSAPDFSFGKADEEAFGCLALAKEAGRTGGTLPTVMNAANEVANYAFRCGQCGFLDVERIVGHTMELSEPQPVESLQQLHEVDERSREVARSVLSEVGR
ncbi:MULTISPECIES: 1-deoxy-D-xylulose-5-phosphate reductoisomerase [Atopobiaceae]|uniref:1-deoxy-D-xylulose 5-phosphate reductoisomerase n=1 Tax=Parafannyhessea umbonata TaxID=604330 RepID=A0A1H6J5Z5_9ACTN|nr:MULTISPECIES: 1-deoxy-D-xylulose-5-phosphate reductoisomerase [Atopobiaceae]SEH57347.1 1-deoxy-D-xylulose 5-phosphate reductoisomerase [Parafannyhessea umbonata]SJZ50429.1 1-deoxy-D-xylulose 5-phosphate reductoisomerase [Olsenella sp. KH1P3]